MLREKASMCLRSKAAVIERAISALLCVVEKASTLPPTHVFITRKARVISFSARVVT